jgi:hypothetical protein
MLVTNSTGQDIEACLRQVPAARAWGKLSPEIIELTLEIVYPSKTIEIACVLRHILPAYSSGEGA